MRTPVQAAAVLAVVIAAGVAVAVTRPFSSEGRSSDGTVDKASFATVERGRLSAQVNQNGTLGYAAKPDGSAHSVVNQSTGIYTRLPSAGRVVRCGQVLYRVTNNPVVLLCGHTPAYRSLSEGMSGPDVRELNANLVRLGYSSRYSKRFGARTVRGVKRLQDDLGVDETGSLELGQAVFLPGPLRITKTMATPGTMARPGAPVAQATATRRQVKVDLDASQQSAVKVGDRAQITLPDNRTTTGVVSRIGAVATSSRAGGPGPKIAAYIRLKHPRAVRRLDHAPVQVQITTAGVKDALIVPVTALVALAGGGYGVETADHDLVRVTLGLFDDADGLVQVKGAGLAAGQRVVVPAT